MSPLAACVLSLLVGCLAGGSGELEVSRTLSAWVLVAGGASLVLAARLGWASHTRLAILLAVAAATACGIALSTRADAAAWTPDGPGIVDLEQASRAAEVICRSTGRLRRDAWSLGRGRRCRAGPGGAPRALARPLAGDAISACGRPSLAQARRQRRRLDARASDPRRRSPGCGVHCRIATSTRPMPSAAWRADGYACSRRSRAPRSSR